MKTYYRAEGVSCAELGDELTLLEPLQGIYYGLDPVGARIWALLDGVTLDALVARLVREYDVDPEQCRQDVAAILHTLHERGLIRVEG